MVFLALNACILDFQYGREDIEVLTG